MHFCAEHGIHPPIHEVLPLAEARRGFAAMLDGELFGKLVVTP